MPYDSVADVPDHVPKSKRKQWLEVWNSSYARHHDEGRAFAEANSVVSGKIKTDMFGKPLIKAAGTTATGFVRAIEGPFRCGHCEHMQKEAGKAGICLQSAVNADPQLKDEPRDNDGKLLVAGGDCCNEYDPVKTVSAEKAKAMTTKFRKFIPFVKVDAAKREVAGIVTAEVPDKDNEVCDYEGSKPYYQAVISEMGKATNGANFFPLREMHQLKAAGKCVGFQFKDTDREIVMTFKVVDDDAWKKVDEGVYTGFSQGGSIVGDLAPDPVYKNCKRYVADPSEVSLVDNPCLGVAHFAYVKADGVVELRKVRSEKVEADDHSGESTVPTGSSQPQPVEIPETMHKEETKRDGVHYLVTDGDKGYLPVSGPDGKPDKRLAGAAWAALHSNYRGHSYEGPDKSGAISRLNAIYDKEGWDKPSDKARKMLSTLRISIRKWANKNDVKISKLSKSRCQLLLYKLDSDLGYLTRKQPLAKGMYEVSRLACSIQDMACMVCAIHNEQEWEQDEESQVAEKLATNVNGLLDTFLEYAQEEVGEMKTALATI